jgi:hypothetical protein
VADGILPLNGVAIPGGQNEDVEDLIGAGGAAVIRQRIQVTGALLAEIARVMNVDPTGVEYGLVTRPIQPRSSAAVVTQVNASIVRVPLLAANPLRKQAMLQTAPIITGGTLSLFFGANLVATVVLAPGAYYELPEPIFDGALEGVWDSLIGGVFVTELT